MNGYRQYNSNYALLAPTYSSFLFKRNRMRSLAFCWRVPTLKNMLNDVTLINYENFIRRAALIDQLERLFPGKPKASSYMVFMEQFS